MHGFYRVSIHTPTQGVTLSISPYPVPSSCFNPHTHAGCDTWRPWDVSCTRSFNPHTHAGCDAAKAENAAAKVVSIHTPTQGVTGIIVYIILWIVVSIHTPTQGVTLYLITYYKSANLIHCYANHHYYSTS